MMSTNFETHDGVLLQAIPYLGNRRILKVFTQEAGLLTLMAPFPMAPYTPFCRAEWVIRSRQTEIQPLKDASLLDPFDSLRQSYELVATAGALASDVLRSQWPHRPAPLLYALLLASFKHLAKAPIAIRSSFRLKLLECEGFLHLQQQCASCGQPASCLQGGESVCSSHASPSSIYFEPGDWAHLFKLCTARRYSEFEGVLLPPIFLERIERLFEERLRH